MRSNEAIGKKDHCWYSKRPFLEQIEEPHEIMMLPELEFCI
jgi:hypothetical protein